MNQELNIADEVRKLVFEHEVAISLLHEIIATFRLPANRMAMQAKIPELTLLADSFIIRYARAFEKEKR